ncbi:uncharacterized protein EAF01_001034 [Botrytis porri]|uniref:uncharacterized protein n=1 Tax=Botrytis porri TaxID=87229 RepID=UPI0019012A78|nr:uncharacterized protein EAF01_001034 [Botrytis porri]KAF7914628.1 hypothetical protein EAF01_001034 [Botrytis porri]
MATENAQANSSGVPQEKDFSHNSNHYGDGSNSYEIHNMSIGSEDALQRIKTTGSISISPELFEKIYLSPQNAVKGDLRKTFGNPTPVAIVGFLITLSPLSCDLMGWRGAGNNGAAGIGSYFFFGGLLMIVGGFLEFVLGNTFPFVVFISFGAFWLTFASTLQPFYYAYGLYAPSGANRLQVAAGATLFVTSLAGWWIFFAIMLAALDFPFQIPVGDLSTLIRGASEREKSKEQMA